MRKFACVFWLGVVSASVIVSPAFAAAPTKSIRECGKEFAAREDALAAKGISAASFYHECWWHSQPGKPTTVGTEARREQSPAQHATTQTRQTRPRPEDERARADRAEPADRAPQKATTTATTVQGGAGEAPVRHAAAASIQRLGGAAHASVRERRSRRARLARAWTPFRIGREARVATPVRRIVATPGTYRPAVRTAAFIGTALTAVPVPFRAFDGRRTAIVARTAAGAVRVSALMIGPPRRDAGGSGLRCWNQAVLFTRGRPHWAPSLVCSGSPEIGPRPVLF